MQSNCKHSIALANFFRGMSKKRSPSEIQNDSRSFLKGPKDNVQRVEVNDDDYEDPWEDEFDEEEYENECQGQDTDDDDSSHLSNS